MNGWSVLFYGLYLWVLICLFALTIYINYSRQLKIISLLFNDGEPKKFLKSIDAQIKRVKNIKLKNMLFVNKSAGLYYDGQFEEAYNLLKSIDPGLLPTKFYTLYFNNLLSIMLLLGKINEAAAIIKEKEVFLLHNSRTKRLNQAIRHTLASYQFYLGDIKKSKLVFIQLAKEKLNKISLADVNYYLGLIESKEGNINTAKEYFEIALENSGATYLRERINEALLSIAK